MVSGTPGGLNRRRSLKSILALSTVIAAVVASLPAGASAEVISPQVVKPTVVKPQAVPVPPAAAPTPAPSRGSAGAPSSSPVRPYSPTPVPVGDAPDPSPGPVGEDEKPPLPKEPDYDRFGLPTCLTNNTDVEARCKCDRAWCLNFSEVKAYERWENEHRDVAGEQAEIKAEKEAAAAADKAVRALDQAAAENPDLVKEFIEAVLAFKEMLEKSIPLSAEEKCQCSFLEPDNPSLHDYSGDVSALGPRQPGVATAAEEIAGGIGGALAGAKKLFEELHFSAN